MVELLSQVCGGRTLTSGAGIYAEILTAGPRNASSHLPAGLTVAHKSAMPGTRTDVGIVSPPDGTLIVMSVRTGVRASEPNAARESRRRAAVYVLHRSRDPARTALSPAAGSRVDVTPRKQAHQSSVLASPTKPTSRYLGLRKFSDEFLSRRLREPRFPLYGPRILYRYMPCQF